MKHKFLLATVVALGLASITPITTSTPVHAITWTTTHKPYFITRKVKLTKNTRFYKMRIGNYDYLHHNYNFGSKVLKKGTTIKVKRVGSWIVTSPKLKQNPKSFWICKHFSQNWFTTKLKKKNSKILKKDKKPYFVSTPFKGTYVNIPNKGKMHFEGLDVTRNQLVFHGKFDNPYSKQINLNDYLSNHIQFWDVRLNHALQFTTSTIVQPHQTANFEAVCPTPAYEQEAAHDGLDIDIRIDALKNRSDIVGIGSETFTAQPNY